MKEPRETDLLLQNAKNIHMIGIGGAGMFPIAEILHEKGYALTGSDNNETDTLKRVRALGIPVTLGHAPENVEGSDLIIYSAAIMKDNPELVAAAKRRIPMMERALALGAITRKYDHVIGVCGTHGKTTVASMLTQILMEGGQDPTAVIGGRLPLIDGNGRAGTGELMVCEACEFVDTFLQLSPDMAVILNIDEDHMEYFKTLDNLISSFRKFARMAKTVIVNGEDRNSLEAVKGMEAKTVSFGLSDSNDFYAANIVPGVKTAGEFDFMHKGESLCHVILSVPGAHNIANAVAAGAAAFLSGAKPEQIARSLASFKGAGRRFEILGSPNRITIADDYAHHPAELDVTLRAAMKMGYRRVFAVFQPFSYSRTAMLLEDFAQVLAQADQVVLSEIMGSREINTYGIKTTDLCEKIPGAVWFPTFEEIAEYVVNEAAPGDLVITLGCGDIYKAAKLILKKLQQMQDQAIAFEDPA